MCVINTMIYILKLHMLRFIDISIKLTKNMLYYMHKIKRGNDHVSQTRIHAKRKSKTH